MPKSLEDIHPNVAGKYYKELPSEIRRFIDKDIVFSADIIKNIDKPNNHAHQKIATAIFWRLQQGEMLNFMEVAHAELSSLSRNVVVKYSDDITFDYDAYRPVDSNPDKHPFFKLIDRDNKRMEHLKFLTRFLIIEKAGGYAEIKDTAVTEFIEEYIREDGIGNCSLENEGFVKDTLSILSLIYDIFKNDPMVDENSGIKELKTEYVIISFYLLVRHLRKFYALHDKEKEAIKTFFYGFHERWKADEEDDVDIILFSNNRQQSVYNMEVRDRVIRQLFFEYLTENNIEILLKDEKRAFNEAEKISIYRRDKGLCQECLSEGKDEPEAKVSWSNYQADHIFPHSRGGQTTVDNAQVLCAYHNQRKSNRVVAA
ncbi:MAG: HNH endonuclease [Alphaproteobacteria bacterium]|nr:HNH endonuclease [Alphaproteobacteria bacterium]